MNLISELLNLIQINSSISKISNDDNSIQYILENSLRVGNASSAYLLQVSTDNQVRKLNEFSNSNPLPYSKSSAINAARTGMPDFYNSNFDIRNDQSISANQIFSIMSFYLLENNSTKLVLQVVGKDTDVFKQEILTLMKLFATQAKISIELNHLNKQTINASKDQARIDLARQVAHDIRPPLEVLLKLVPLANFQNQEDFNLVSDSISKIQNIANNLLDDLKPIKEQLTHFVSLKITINKIISALKHHKSSSDIIFDISYQFCSADMYCSCNPILLETHLSNLLINSLEASNHKTGTVKIALSQVKDFILVEIKNQGRQIPSHVLNKLGTEEVTFGKEQGNGLGFFNAKKFFKEIQGDLQIESSPSETVVSVRIPFSEKPTFMVSRIMIPWLKDIAITSRKEDQKTKDESLINPKVHIYEIINEKQQIPTFSDEGIAIFSTESFELLKQVVSKNSKDNLFILSLSKHLEDFVWCKELYPAIILVDDDKYIRLNWENSARIHNVKLFTLPNYELLFEKMTDFPENSFFFLDNHIKNERLASLGISFLKQKGIKNIMAFEQIEHHPDVLYLNSKTPPWEKIAIL